MSKLHLAMFKCKKTESEVHVCMYCYYDDVISIYQSL